MKNTNFNENKNKYKRLIVSDLHLGSQHSRVDLFLELLKSIEVDEIILNGDIIDVISLNNKQFKNWPKEHSVVLQKILKFIRHGGKVIWIKGNHELNLIDSFLNEEISGIYFCEEYIINNEILIYHGDKLDFLVKGKFEKLSEIGAIGYETLLNINSYFRKFFFVLNPNFSLSSFVKSNLKKVMQYITSFEVFAVEDAKLRNFNTVILGHIHQHNDKKIGDIRYLNSGCWMNDCEPYYIVENLNGSIELKKFNQHS